MSSPQPSQSTEPEQEEEWYLKSISFHSQPRKIICQNLNGPCSFIAICNVLLLRGDIALAAGRESVTYSYMAQLLGDYLLTHCPGVDVGAALSMMPLTTRGMDLNPLFTSQNAFRPSGDGGALALFQHAGIHLVHGWLVDPDSPEYTAVAKAGDYDTAVNLVVEADHLTGGKLVHTEDDFDGAAAGSSSGSGASAGKTLTPEHRSKVQDAIHIRTFLDNTSSQLTYRGLFDLSATLPPGELFAFFRNSHLSVLYKPSSPQLKHEEPHFSSKNPFADIAAAEAASLHPSPVSTPAPLPSAPTAEVAQDPNALYLLVTDSSFLREPSVVWEALRDIDGQTSSFFDGAFAPAQPAGGDFAGLERDLEGLRLSGREEDNDQQLAIQLQREEDARAQAEWAKRQEQAQQQAQRREQEDRLRALQVPAPPRMKRKGSCLIM